MKKISAIVLTLAIILTSCGADPVKFNDTLVDCTNKAHKQIDVLTNDMSSALASEEYSSIATSVKSTIDSLNIYIETASNLKAPKDGVDFQNGVVTYIKSLVTGCETYSAYATITNDTTNEQFNAINDAAKKIENEQDKLYDDLTSKQKVFAKANNLELTD